MNKAKARFLSVFTLLSRLPVRAVFEPDYSRADFWMPAISPLVSLAAAAGAGAGWLLFRDPLLAALCAIALQYWCFNLFHLDGLLDSADALAPFAAREKRLAILKDSRIGSYAFFYGWLALAARLAALAALFRAGPAFALAGLLAAPLAGRTASAIVPLMSAPARPDGLGALMKGFSPWRVAAGFLAGALPGAACAIASARYALALAAGVAALAAALAAGSWMARLYRSRVDGFTGDALGAAVELGELLCLLALAILSGGLGAHIPGLA
jgi:adenosylcobinamide-GDP ribazoletransferase